MVGQVRSRLRLTQATLLVSALLLTAVLTMSRLMAQGLLLFRKPQAWHRFVQGVTVMMLLTKELLV
jgi:hypothetical protein